MVFTLTRVKKEAPGHKTVNRHTVLWEHKDVPESPFTVIKMNSNTQEYPDLVLRLFDSYDNLITELKTEYENGSEEYKVQAGLLVGHYFKLCEQNFMSSLFGMDYATNVMDFSISGLNGHEIEIFIEM